ncbi:MAG: FUSC family protein [Pseudomonadota bacterium]
MSVDSDISSHTRAVTPPGARFSAVSQATLAPRLLFGIRLATSVCLALYTTYYLELPNPFWAATTAAIVCQPNLGASLQKGRFRALGTVIGAVVLVALLALFPQDRLGFLLSLSLWCGLCGCAVVLLRASAAYAAGLSGITAAILFADSVADPTSAFFLGLTRVSEICIGILAVAVVMLLTEPGVARLALAGLMERIASELRAGFLRTLACAGETPQMQAARREVVKMLTPLHVAIDAAIGESASLYARRGTFHSAMAALADALVGWRTVSHHRFPDDSETAALQRGLAERLALINPTFPEHSATDAQDQARSVLADIEALAQDTLSARLLVRATRTVAVCLSAFIAAVVLLRTGEGERTPSPRRPFVIADGLPALIAGVRACLSMGAVALVWMVTAWPNGPFAVAFAAVSTLIFAAFPDEGRMRAADYAIGVGVMAALGSVIYFFVLPALSTFPALVGLLFLLFVPLGMMQVGSWHSALFLAMSISSLPLLGMGNPLAYDPAGYFNVAFAIFAGSAVGPLFFVLLAPPPPEQRADRLIRLSVRDLRRLIRAPRQPDGERWRALLTRRLESIPPQATAEQHGALLSLLAMGEAVENLRKTVPDGVGAEVLATALTALAQGETTKALEDLEKVSRLAEPASAAGGLDVQVQVAVLADSLPRHAALLAALATGPWARSPA